MPTETSAEPTPQATITFADFGLDPLIQKAVSEQGYTSPTPIQAQAIPHVLLGQDLMGAAQTGTGKTAAFVLPIIQRILRHASSSASPARHPIRALVLTPTRELAVQVAENAANYSRHTDLRSAVVYGGVDMKEQVATLRGGIEILIATPGRLLDHIGSKVANLSQVELLVLDEADRMLDMGFLPDLQRIINLIPAQRQTLLFSATFSPEIKKLAQSYLRNPVTVEVARQNAAADTVRQVIHMVRSGDKEKAIVKILASRTEQGLSRQCIIFTNSRMGCARLARALERDGIKAGAIHGDKSQGERTLTLDAFKSGAIEALVATDVAARGLDIPAMPCVINHELPFNAEDFIHRIGRTGRAGSTGDAIALVDDSEKRLLDDIEKLMKRKLEIMPLPNIDIPGGNESDDRPRHRSSRETTQRSYSTPTPSRTSAPPADPFFFTPYESPKLANKAEKSDAAQAEGASPQPEVKKVGIVPAKPPVGALLGGFKKK
ncbi:DEAD/DEAH box helicase [Polynucleobacter paneuropaeus]|uniref:ATP-dependent helicase n=1 Tax=Polynucleobacter paneuropaeus TaxID=2527775 RepID=A0ABX9FA11_9BURK|nr:DEAD/DEAH box helicase [Polynucleobacter paneuropaeus]AWW48780.1 ATP-dependent helicase [Polynucleobacter paneuropaeus]MBT8523711.1 DEAD/DEAH box helicase [Polynucleobacter paneuropaeus]MBT8529412.1 DEAD/DEAH box helicase [Polynucleobacter paneuropaeus]MBT8541113.1 DEAD/DEAH box helicase [Polynucleobacter paneuropaeus]MBT8544233.1 DEAD/DEAH box helicase [Polynucleobacter paneuropaeus]